MKLRGEIKDFEMNVVEQGGITYQTWFSQKKSAFGNYLWGITNLTTEEGVGGFASSRKDAQKKIKKALKNDPNRVEK